MSIYYVSKWWPTLLSRLTWIYTLTIVNFDLFFHFHLSSNGVNGKINLIYAGINHRKIQINSRVFCVGVRFVDFKWNIVTNDGDDAQINSFIMTQMAEKGRHHIEWSVLVSMILKSLFDSWIFNFFLAKMKWATTTTMAMAVWNTKISRIKAKMANTNTHWSRI